MPGRSRVIFPQGGPITRGSPAGPANDPFPRTAWQAISPGSGSGSSYAYASSTYQENAAKFNIVCDGPYPGIEQTMGNTTFATINSNIKGAASENGITPCRLGHYTMSSEQSLVGDEGDEYLYTVWSEDLQANNWWIRSSYPSGSIVTEDTDSGVIAITSQNTIVDSNSRTVGEAYWYHYDNMLRQGNGVSLGYASDLAFAANPDLDFYQMDNVFCTPRATGAWGMSTTSYAAGNATAAAWLQQGQAAQVAALKAIAPNLLVWGNCDYFAHSTSVFGTEVTLDPSQNGIWDMVYCQSCVGGPNGIEGEGSTTTAQLMANLIAAEAQMSPTGTLLFECAGASYGNDFSNQSQSSWTDDDWQAARFALCCALMRNYHFMLNSGEDYSPAKPYFMDETLPQGGVTGYLGISENADPPQSAARIQGVWYRVWQPSGIYPGGVAFMNPKGNGVQEITLSNLGLSGLSALASQGYGDTDVNTGEPVTTITLQDRDGRVLIF